MADKSIVFCTDFSPNADKAFDVAKRLAADWGANLLVVHAVSGGDELAAAALTTWLPFKNSLTERLNAKYVATAGVEAEAVVLRGSPAKEIVGFIAARRPDLVVIGVRGESAARGFRGGGSITNRIINNSATPVLCVPD